jgi:heme-degrading monooxygenase HmoA
MSIIISRRRLEADDSHAWRARFESGVADRKAAGCRGVRRFRGIDDAQEVLLIFDWDSLENFNAYVASKVAVNPKLAETRDGGGLKLENILMEELPPLEH